MTLPRYAGALATTGVFMLLVGCGGGHFGSTLSASPRPQPLHQADGATLRLPQEAPFSIALPQSSRAAGLGGQADADAQAKSDGQAEVSARVTTSGTAEGLFQLGHALSNDTDRQADVDFRVRFTYEFETRAGPDVRQPDAAVGLKLYARDQRGRLLREMTLVSHTTESGPTSRQSTEDLRFTLTVGPGTALDVFLAGQARVEISADRSASARLALRDLQIEVVSRPAPAVRTASHERP